MPDSSHPAQTWRRWVPRPLRAALRRMRAAALQAGRQTAKEWSFFVHMAGVRGFLPAAGGGGGIALLATQKPRDVALDIPPTRDPVSLRDLLRDRGVEYAEGQFSLYLAPSAFRQIAARAAQAYPPDSGLKVLKDGEARADRKYVSTRMLSDASRVAIRNQPTLSGLVAVANALWLNGLGAPVRDLVVLHTGHTRHMAFVVGHVSGRVPGPDEYAAFLNRLDNYLRVGPLALVLPHWREHKDLAPPDCNANLIMPDGADSAVYVDFQNFLFKDWSRFVKACTNAARQGTHFGETHLLAGGRYLYQSVPGIARLSKRDSERRFTFILRMLTGHGIALDGCAVLDIGCNIGMMMAQALREGASWALGWDRETVAEHTRRILYAIGCSRFAVVGADLHAEYDFASDVPPWVAPRLHESVVFFLAMRKHIGVPSAIAAMPWRALVYEGHTGDGPDETHRYLQDLSARTGARVVASASYQDRMTQRPIALLVRDGAGKTTATQGGGIV
jgi:hypothetical protein